MIANLLAPKKVSFYTTGFMGREVADLKPLLAKLDAVLIDIRMSLHSQSVQWNQAYLKILLKGQYRHIAQLGNRHSEKGTNAIQHLALGVHIVTSFKMNAVLCECADARSCHRTVIAQELSRQGFSVQELESWEVTGIG